MDNLRHVGENPRQNPRKTVRVRIRHAYDLLEARQRAETIVAEGNSPVAVAPKELHGRVAALGVFDLVVER